MRIFQLIILQLILLLSVISQAAMVKDLYVGIVPVAERSNTAVNKVAPDALRQVLIKMTGDPSVANNPIIEPEITNASQLMQSFSYMSQPSSINHELLVKVSFDKNSLISLLSKADIAVWRADRPMTLAWVQVDNSDNKPSPVLSSEDQSPAALAVSFSAKQLGLPFVFPAMDLQDQSLIQDSDAGLPFDLVKLEQAGERYHAHSILAGKLSIAIDGSWQGQWMYLLNDVPHQWNTLGQTSADVIHQAMLNMEGIIAGEIAAKDSSKLQGSVDLKITGVTSLDDYAAILHTLKQQESVAKVSVAQLDGSTMHLKLDVVGGKKALQDILDSQQNLTADNGLTVANSGLVYDFNSKPDNESSNGGQL